jgi:hypothetical protein
MFTEKGYLFPCWFCLKEASVSLFSYKLVTSSTGNDATLNGGRGLLLLPGFRNSK